VTLNVKWSITPKRLKNNLIINYTMSDNDEIMKPTKKRAALSDEKRAELAARMRAINDKRIEDAYNKIQAEKKTMPKTSPEVKTPEPVDLGKTETPEIPKKEPKKKKVIQIIQVESDDEDIEIQMPKKKEGARGNVVPPQEPPKKTRKPRQPKERDDEAILKQKQTPPPAPVLPPQQPIVRCKFL
jgi:hypothetical protein